LDVQKQLYNIGVDMQVEVVRPQDFDGRVRSGDFEATFMDLVGGPSLGRAYVFWASARSFSGLNLFGYENTEVERLFGVLRTTTNEAAIRSATGDLQRELLNDPPAIFIAWNERARAVRREFQIEQDPRRDPTDPIYTIWRWTPSSARSSTP
jgi:ABC-type oligopeptide transport system substrate-binding subunit